MPDLMLSQAYLTPAYMNLPILIPGQLGRRTWLRRPVSKAALMDPRAIEEAD